MKAYASLAIPLGLALSVLFVSWFSPTGDGQPWKKAIASAPVTDFRIRNDRLYVASEEGMLDVLGFPSLKSLLMVRFDPIRDHFGREVLYVGNEASRMPWQESASHSGHMASLVRLQFIGENMLLSAAEEEVCLWKLDR